MYSHLLLHLNVVVDVIIIDNIAPEVICGIASAIHDTLRRGQQLQKFDDCVAHYRWPL